MTLCEYVRGTIPGFRRPGDGLRTAASPWSQQEHQPNTGWPDASYGDSHKGGDGFFSVEVHRSSQSNDPPT